MNWRLIALIALLMGLSRVAFPAEHKSWLVKTGTRVTRAAKRGKIAKSRPMPVRRAPAPARREILTPLIPAPTVMHSLVTPPEMPEVIRELVPVIEAAQPVLRAAAPVRPDDTKPLRRSMYWTAERAAALSAASGHVLSEPRATLVTVAGGDPRLTFHHQPAVRVAFRI